MKTAPKEIARKREAAQGQTIYVGCSKTVFIRMSIASHFTGADDPGCSDYFKKEKTMSDITDYGNQLVKEALDDAENELIRAKGNLTEAERRFAYMQKVSACDHETEVTGYYVSIASKCKKCGFEWHD